MHSVATATNFRESKKLFNNFRTNRYFTVALHYTIYSDDLMSLKSIQFKDLVYELSHDTINLV